MKNDGFSIKECNATFKSHMVGTDVNIPSGFVVYEAFYILRGGLKAQELLFDAHQGSHQKIRAPFFAIQP